MITRALSGVYEIVNTTKGRRYIGSTKNFNKRFNDHKNKLKQNKHSNVHLQRAYNKDTLGWQYNILLYCEINELVTEEQRIIDEIGVKQLYNILPKAYSLLDAKRNKAQIHQFSTYWKGRTRAERTLEHREKLGESRKGCIAWNKGSATSTCKQCLVVFPTQLNVLRRGYAKYCSRKCKALSQEGKSISVTTQFYKGQVPWNKKPV